MKYSRQLLVQTKVTMLFGWILFLFFLFFVGESQVTNVMTETMMCGTNGVPSMFPGFSSINIVLYCGGFTLPRAKIQLGISSPFETQLNLLHTPPIY